MKMDFVPISGFPKGTWRLDWPSEIRKNVQQPDDYEVQVQFSRIINLHVDIFSDEATRTNSGERSDIALFWISVGFTPVIQRGSLWQDGCPIMFSPRNWGREQTLPIYYQFYIPFAGTDRVRARDVIPENELLGNAFSDCWCRTLNYGSKRIVIPVWELIRFYYCSSSKLANVLFAGELTNSKLIVPKDTFLRKDGIFQLYLQKEFYDEDAPVILRLTQSKVAHARAAYIHKSLWANAIDGIAWVDTDFPFIGKTLPAFYGRWLPDRTSPNSIFLVMRIGRCSHPFPYEKLGVERENPGVEAAPLTDGTVNTGAGTRTIKGAAGLTTFQPAGGGGRGPKIVKIALPEQKGFGFFDNKEIIYLYQLRRAIIEGRCINHALDSQNALAVGPLTSESHVRPASVVRTEEESVTESDTDDSIDTQAIVIEPWFQELLDSLRKLESRGVAWMVKNPATRMQGKQVSKTFFPLQPDSARLQWMYLDKNKKQRRAGMWVEIKFSGHYCYLFELERRQDESYGLYVLYRSQGNGWVTYDEMLLLMKRWGRGRSQQTEAQNQANGWLRRSLHHTVNQSLDDLAERIFRVLTEMNT